MELLNERVTLSEHGEEVVDVCLMLCCFVWFPLQELRSDKYPDGGLDDERQLVHRAVRVRVCDQPEPVSLRTCLTPTTSQEGKRETRYCPVNPGLPDDAIPSHKAVIRYYIL